MTETLTPDLTEYIKDQKQAETLLRIQRMYLKEGVNRKIVEIPRPKDWPEHLFPEKVFGLHFESPNHEMIVLKKQDLIDPSGAFRILFTNQEKDTP